MIKIYVKLTSDMNFCLKTIVIFMSAILISS